MGVYGKVRVVLNEQEDPFQYSSFTHLLGRVIESLVPTAIVFSHTIRSSMMD